MNTARRRRNSSSAGALTTAGFRIAKSRLATTFQKRRLRAPFFFYGDGSDRLAWQKCRFYAKGVARVHAAFMAAPWRVTS
jgi:hypothetical protein